MAARISLAVGALLLAAACHDEPQAPADGAPPPPPPPPPELTCRELADEWKTLAAAFDRSCNRDTDCVIAGGHVGVYMSPASCNCVLWLTPVAGRRIPDPMTALLDSYEIRCASDPSAIRICDAAPTRATCVDGSCQTETPSCLDPG